MGWTDWTLVRHPGVSSNGGRVRLAFVLSDRAKPGRTLTAVEALETKRGTRYHATLRVSHT